jgi:tRNA (guanine37-N1)-methyltransferase
MKIHVITLFPEMFAALNYGIPKRAIEGGKLFLNLVNPRDFTFDKHKTVDDRTYGGGPGMVMKAEPLSAAIDSVKQFSPSVPVFYLSPQGKKMQQQNLENWSTYSDLVLIAGRYEGIDERLIQTRIDAEHSVGDYVLSGGELAAMVIIDGIARLLPGVLGDEESAKQDSFTTGLLDHPHYTRPEVFNGLKVPEVLLKGDHRAIAQWRLKQALGRTYLRRPDLLKDRILTEMEKKLLEAFIKEQTNESQT